MATMKEIRQFLDERSVQGLLLSPILSLMVDEAPDVWNVTELSVCMGYLNSAGCIVECFQELVSVSHSNTETISKNFT